MQQFRRSAREFQDLSVLARLRRDRPIEFRIISQKLRCALRPIVGATAEAAKHFEGHAGIMTICHSSDVQ